PIQRDPGLPGGARWPPYAGCHGGRGPMIVERWALDVLGERFERLTLPLGSDDEGEVVATLVRYRPKPEPWWAWPWKARPAGEASGTDVLYVHGWSDYYFNRELAEFWSAAGARFFA